MWHLISGEYPPQCGGVGDYTEQLAAALAARDPSVHVWCPGPPTGTELCSAPGVHIHRLLRGFSLAGLRSLEGELNRYQPPRRLLVQYVPNSFGMRGLNVPFCLWLLNRARRHRDDVRLMFHEPYFYFTWRRPHRNLLALVQRGMAALLLAASRVVYLSIPAWERCLRPYALGRKPPMLWAPIPATVPWHLDPAGVAALRNQCSGGRPRLIVGHFGTYGQTTTLARVLLELLGADENLVGKLIGMNGDRFAAALVRDHPQLRGRLFATGYQSPVKTSLHLQSCDLLVQPYPDGASSRRTSLMAGLANGAPTLTTVGALTEPLWQKCSGLPLAPAEDVACLVAKARALLAAEAWRQEVGRRGRAFYDAHFSLARTLSVLGVTGEGTTNP